MKKSSEECPQKEEPSSCAKPDLTRKKKPPKPVKLPYPPLPETGVHTPIFEFPHFLRIIGPKHIQIFMRFIPSALFYGLTSLILVAYAAEWKDVLQFVPFYNWKYHEKKQEQEERQMSPAQEEECSGNEEIVKEADECPDEGETGNNQEDCQKRQEAECWDDQ